MVVVVVTGVFMPVPAAAQSGHASLERPPDVQLTEVPELQLPAPDPSAWRMGTKVVAVAGASLAITGIATLLAGLPHLLDPDGLDNGEHSRGFALMMAGGVLGMFGLLNTLGAWSAERRRDEAAGLRPPALHRRDRLLGAGHTLTAAGTLAIVLGAALSDGTGFGLMVGGAVGAVIIAAGIPVLIAGYSRRRLAGPVLSLRVGPARLAFEARF